MSRLALVLALSLVATSACVASHITRIQPAQFGDDIVAISASKTANFAYLIDPRTEACFFIVGATGVTPVDCATLARHVPEAAAHITWLAPGQS